MRTVSATELKRLKKKGKVRKKMGVQPEKEKPVPVTPAVEGKSGSEVAELPAPAPAPEPVPELRGQMQTIAAAKMSMGEQATVRALQEEMLLLKHLMDELLESNNRLVQRVGTVSNELNQFKQQWNIERQSWRT